MKFFTRPPCINRLRLDFAQSKSRPKVLQVPIQSQHGALQSEYEVDESDSSVGSVRGEKKLGNDDELDEDVLTQSQVLLPDNVRATRTTRYVLSQCLIYLFLMYFLFSFLFLEIGKLP